MLNAGPAGDFGTIGLKAAAIEASMSLGSKEGSRSMSKESLVEKHAIIVEDSHDKEHKKRVITKPVSNIINQEIYTQGYSNLRMLLKNDFVMSTDDKDFKLTHEQLIKVCRLFLNMIQVTR